MNQIDVADLDCIYLTYDEPQKEEFWVKIRNMVPWAKRVDGVKGSDAAHKAAAAASETERFILIDGDNMPYPEFFNQTLTFPTADYERAVFRWRACNNINGLMYGNGGMSSWTRTFVNQMKTHENTDGTAATEVEFCFDPLYWAMHDCYSTTYPNGSAFHAWRAGFREGVKMCLDRGSKPSLQDFESRVHSRNYDHLCVWQTVGADAENGFWAIYGARLGTYLTMLCDWEYRWVQDFDTLEDVWNEYKDRDVEHCKELGDTLRTRLGLPIVDMDPEESKFFKHHYKSNFVNRGIMNRE
jgi:hypothetical protein